MLSSAQIAQLELQLNKLFDQCQVVTAAVVATIDGHFCAQKQRANTYSLERLATMGSTLMSLGDTITAELKMGGCDNVISENREGIVVFMHVGRDLVLVTLTTQKNALGMLLSHTRRCVEELTKTL